MAIQIVPEIFDNWPRKLGLIINTKRVFGGDINHSLMVQTAKNKYFLKWHEHSPPRLFQAEADGLKELAKTKTVRVPEPKHVYESANSKFSFFALEWLDLKGDKNKAADKMGEQLAKLHRTTQEKYGWTQLNYVGRLPQYNWQMDSWPEFFWRQRILPQLELAKQKGFISPEMDKKFDLLKQKITSIIPSDVEASLLHGDLWAGNWAVLSSGEPVIYDPSVYYGHREVDLAMTELFGGFPDIFYDAYHAEWPIDPEYKERKFIYQLYPLMVHMNLFGTGYVSQVEAVLNRFV